jgi:glycosyltransferase involved in cell wall biosynthesis
MRVAIVSATYPPTPGGVARHVADVAKALHSNGVDVSVITKAVRGLAANEKIDGVQVLRMRVPGPRVSASSSFVLDALRCLARLHPDIIHSHELTVPTTTAVTAKLMLRVPVVVTAHTSGPLIGDVAKISRAFLGKQRLSLLRSNVDKFVATSHVIDGEMAAVGIPAMKRVLIPNGIDMNHFAPVDEVEKRVLRRKLSLPDSEIVVFTGRLVWEKRVHHLLAIWPTIRKLFPNAILLILGSGPLEEDLRQQNVEGVHFTGLVQDVAPYLKASDLLVMPSRYEGFSLSALEGIACGLPVVATRVGAIPDLVNHGTSGYIVSPDDIAALQDTIVDLLKDPERRIAFGQYGRRHAEGTYSLHGVADSLSKVYDSLVISARRKTKRKLPVTSDGTPIF